MNAREAYELAGRITMQPATLVLQDGTEVQVHVGRVDVDVDRIDVTTADYWAKYGKRQYVEGRNSIMISAEVTG